MKKTKFIMTAVFSLLIVFSVLVASAVIAVVNKNAFTAQNFIEDSSSDLKEESVIESDAESSETSTDDTQSDETSETPADTFNELVGIYHCEDAAFQVFSSTDGYIESALIKDGISVEFSGQLTENTLNTEAIDSKENSIGIYLEFQGSDTCLIKTELILAGETEEFLSVDGTFIK